MSFLSSLFRPAINRPTLGLGVSNVVFNGEGGLPLLDMLGPGEGIMRQLHVIQPPQEYYLHRAPTVGVGSGGVYAGQIIGQPLITGGQ